MIKVLAVSGGVDSMVMLDLMRKKFSPDELVVATFDHGTRESSSKDADFVSQIGSALNLKVFVGKAKLGSKVSEETARRKRYEFLRKVAAETDGEIYTAHHLDDMVESIAINIGRGTGFRGLAVLNAPDLKRPFLDDTFDKIFDKREVLKYAANNNIVFRHDSTNTDEKYLRNRLRPCVSSLSHKEKKCLFELWQKQVNLVREIDESVEKLIPNDLSFEREWFKKLDEKVGLEILRAALLKIGVSATRLQLRDFLSAICEYDSGKKFNLPGDKLVQINRKKICVKNMIK